MHYRTLGHTGIRISAMGFAISGGGPVAKASRPEQLRTIQWAIEHGINYFESGGDPQEPILGNIFRELGAKPLIAMSLEVTPQALPDIPRYIERRVGECLDRLKVDRVDVVNITTLPDPPKPRTRRKRGSTTLSIEHYLGDAGVIDGLQRIVRAGKARLLGLTCLGNDAASVEQLIDTGAFDLLNVVYNVINPSATIGAPPGTGFDPDFGQVIPYAYRKGMGTAVHRPLAGGLSAPISAGRAQKPRARTRPAAVSVARGDPQGADVFGFLSVPGEHSLPQAAIRFILSDPRVTTVVAEFPNKEQLDYMADASEAGPLSEKVMIRIAMAWRAQSGGLGDVTRPPPDSKRRPKSRSAAKRSRRK